MKKTTDLDPQETQEWIDSINDVLSHDGKERAQFLLEKVAQALGGGIHSSGDSVTSPHVNTISPDEEQSFPGNIEIEKKIMNINRWNTMAMVTKANKESDGIGGHIASFSSSATFYEVGFNHFFKGPKDNEAGDQVFFQGHISPGIYSRAYLEGIISKTHMSNFRRELATGGGLPSYPHPRLMKNFWQFPTVSMGLGPILAIYTARFNKYLENRKIKDTSKSHVWAFLGDGELGEPEIYGAIPVAKREKLDNLIFVINCNLQRLDGPVYGNGSVMKEAEGMFRGAGWNVIKIVWSSAWNEVLKADTQGIIPSILENTPDGDIQNLPLKSASEIRDFFGQTPEVKELLSLISDEALNNLEWGGHDIKKVYAAYHKATTEKNGNPTVIIAQTIKGYGMGNSGKALNTAHQKKKMEVEPAINYIKSIDIPMNEKDIENFEFYHPGKDSEEIKYIQKIRENIKFNPRRIEFDESSPLPKLDENLYEKFYKGSGQREISTTKSYVQILSALLRDKQVKNHIIPIICDEARTFGMDGFFGQHGIYNPLGQNYTSHDAKSLMPYKEKVDGKILQEGINEAGATASFISAGTSYSYQNIPMIPFYAFYSMFGIQRVGDTIWQATDMRCKGFLMGGTAGRTTLNGEGLQHEDGHSLVMASVYPTLMSFDPAFEFEMASVIKEGINKMYYKGEDCLYYITMYNEDMIHPPKPSHVTDKDINSGMYLYEKAEKKADVHLISGGVILKYAIEAKEILKKKFKLNVNIYSAPSFKKLRDEAIKVERQNLLNPSGKRKTSYVENLLSKETAPFVSATDYVREWSELIRPWIKSRYITLGTDGFGHSSSREELREHFEITPEYIAYSALYSLFLEKKFSLENIKKAQKTLSINPKKISGLDDLAI